VFSLQKSLLESKPEPEKKTTLVNKIVGALNTPISMKRTHVKKPPTSHATTK
jgi:hypothetical protein